MANDRLHERGHSSIGCNDFKSGIDDFDDWIENFERAVKLATSVPAGDRLNELYKEWLHLKLDKTAAAVLKQCANTLTWEQIKAKLKSTLVDPQEKYRWQSKRATIKWDGVETFPTLAARIVRAVDKFDKEISPEMKVREYFFRFREALPKPYRDAIDMGCKDTERTLDNAKDIAQRAHIIQTSDDSSGPAAMAFASATMSDDRISGLERGLAGMTTALENLNSTIRGMAKEQRGLATGQRQLVARMDELEQRYGRRDNRNHSYDRGTWDRGRSPARPNRGFSPGRFSRNPSPGQQRYDRSPGGYPPRGYPPNSYSSAQRSPRGQSHGYSSRDQSRGYSPRDQSRGYSMDQFRGYPARDQSRGYRPRDQSRGYSPRGRYDERSPQNGNQPRSPMRGNQEAYRDGRPRNQDRGSPYPQNSRDASRGRDAYAYETYAASSPAPAPEPEAAQPAQPDSDEERLCAMIDKVMHGKRRKEN